MMQNQPINIFLSGGGMKGAYQYGFFKQLYKRNPDIKIEKMYAASVGALNALPILTKKVDYLKQFWDDVSPCDNILNKWSSIKELTSNKTFFESFKTDKIYVFLSSLSEKEKENIKEKLNVITYNRITQKPVVYKGMTEQKDIVQSIVMSCSYPNLVPQIHPYITDGALVSPKTLFEELFNTEDNSLYPWLVLDISGIYDERYIPKNCNVYRPDTLQLDIMNILSFITLDNKYTKQLIKEGAEHANHYIDLVYR